MNQVSKKLNDILNEAYNVDIALHSTWVLIIRSSKKTSNKTVSMRLKVQLLFVDKLFT